MNILCGADWHIRPTRPVNRIDDFKNVQYNKVEWILNKCVQHKAILAIAGDIFDSATNLCPLSLINKYLDLMSKQYNIDIYAQYGQHDLRYHNPKTFENTPFYTLYASNVINFIKFAKHAEINIYGSNWGEKIPKILNKNKFNVLLIHKMVTKSGPLWPGHTEYVKGNTLLDRHNFDLIVSGDNHQSFVCKSDDKTLINPGSLMRQSSDQLDYEPSVYLFNTKTLKTKRLKIPIAPSHSVFDLDNIQVNKDKIENTKLNDLIDKINNNKLIHPEFDDTLQEIIDNVNPHKTTLDFIHKAQEGDLNV